MTLTEIAELQSRKAEWAVFQDRLFDLKQYVLVELVLQYMPYSAAQDLFAEIRKDIDDSIEEEMINEYRKKAKQS
jgi:hypothetical protein